MTAVAFACLGLLGAIIVVLLVERARAERVWVAERRHLIDAVVVRHAPDLAALSVDVPAKPAVVPRPATPERPGINLDGQLVDERGQVVDESAMVGLPGNL